MSLELAVLSALGNGPAHASALVRLLGTGPDALFSSLEQLQRAGCVAASAPRDVRRGRSTYRLTRRGESELALQRVLARAVARAR